jgi:hypothetical protein
MGYEKVVYLQCDTNGCDAEFGQELRDNRLRKTRQAAHDAGWDVWGDGDYCPQCALDRATSQ